MDVSANSAASAISQLLSGSKLQQDHQIAILKLSNNQTKQAGENAIRLIESVPTPSVDGSLGTRFDAMA